jgi:hypothetical protein
MSFPQMTSHPPAAAVDDTRSVASTTSYRSQAMRPQKLASAASSPTLDKDSEHRQMSPSQSEEDDDDDFKFKVDKKNSKHDKSGKR